LKVPLFLRRKKQQRSEDEALEGFIKNIFGFRPGNIFLYRQAMRHKSIASNVKAGVKDSNERLEFLGDAVLGTIVAEYLFKRYPFREEGFLTETRSKIVSRATLNKLGWKIGINKHLQTTPDLNRHPSSTLMGDAMEALIGAIYIDKGFRFTQQVVIRYLLEIHMDIAEVIGTEVNFKSRIIEWAQHHKYTIEFKLAEEIMLKRQQRQYRIKLLINEKVLAEAVDFSIKAAEQRAAEKGYIKLSEQGKIKTVEAR
jgi:ribonuclease III